MSQTFINPKVSILAAGDKDVLSTKTNTASFIDISFADVIQIESGECSIIAVTKQGHVYGRGKNQYGELALGDKNVRDTWTQITCIPSKVKQVSCKNDHSLFLTIDKVYSCGDNFWGQLGINNQVKIITTPTQVVFFVGKSAIQDVQAGGYHTIVLLADGSLYAMGDKACCGQASATDDFYSPVLVSVGNATKITSICCSRTCTIVKTVNDEYYAFGDAKYQKSPAYGKKVSLTATRIDDVMPKGIKIKKLVATSSAFFLLSDKNNLYVVGNGGWGEMGMNNGLSINKWTLCKKNVADVQTGYWNSFLFIPNPFLFHETSMKWTDILAHFE